jgi:predicted N-acetyltransferase YhbS
LIKYGLLELKDRGVRVARTYGDPSFYQRVGFRQISHETIRSPFELSHPEGWLGQSLLGDSIETLTGDGTCVDALNNPKWIRAAAKAVAALEKS